MKKLILILVFLFGYSAYSQSLSAINHGASISKKSNNKILSKKLKLTSPNGGEKFAVGSNIKITWEGVSAADTMKLEYSLDAGTTWTTITNNATGLSWIWNNIPRLASEQCLVRISNQISAPISSDSAPPVEWKKCYGGSMDDWAQSIQETSDGGYILAGWTNSIDGDVKRDNDSDARGGNFWIIKLSNSGAIEWQKCLGSGSVHAKSIQETSDSGYIVAGLGGTTLYNSDYYIVKLSNKGAIEWQDSLNEGDYDEAESIVETSDGGYIVAGSTAKSQSSSIGITMDSCDYWIVKLTSSGSVEWEKKYGGTKSDIASSIQATNDGGYIIAGFTASNDGDVKGNHEVNSFWDSDYWILKLSSSGDIEWQKCLGGICDDRAYSIKVTNDGGYIVAGYSWSNNGDVSGNHGDGDVWIVKLSNDGGIVWQKCLGGSRTDIATSIQTTNDGGYIIAGYTFSNDGDISKNNGNYDYWLIKLSSSGALLWQKSLGGSGNDEAYSIQETSDGGYVVAGYSASNDGDVSGNHGGFDFWVVKLKGYLSQSDVSDASFSILEPSEASIDVDMRKEYVNSKKDSVIVGFLKNTGIVSCRIDSINFTGADSAQFRIKNCSFPFQLDSGAVQDITFEFAPSSSGMKSATVVVFTQADTLFSSIIGEGILQPLELSTTNIKFDSVRVGNFKDSLIKAMVINRSAEPRNISKISFSGANADDFSLSSGAKDTSFVISATSSAEMSFRFKPTDIGDRICNIDFSYDGQDSALSAELSGFAYRNAQIAATSPKSQYLICEQESSDTIKISNSGNDTLKISSIKISGINSIDFSIANNFYNILPDSLIAIEYRFSPKSIGEKNAQIEIKSNAANDSLLIIPIQGKKDSANIIALVDSINLGLLFTNSPKDTTFIIKNIGNTFDKALISANSPLSVDYADYSLAQNESVELNLKFNGVPNSGDFIDKILIHDTICHRESQIKIIAKIVDFPSAVLCAGSKCAKAGDTISVPIFLKNKNNLSYRNISGFKSELSFNSTILAPLNVSSAVIGATRTISLDMPYKGKSDTLLTVSFIACVGSDTATSLALSEPEIIGDTINLTVENGTFNLLGICKEGGDRLINPNGKTMLLAINPNPSSDKLEIGFSLREDAYTEIYIINSQGARVMDITNQKMNSGDYKASANVQELSTGVYTLVLRTSADFVSERFVIAK